MLQANASSPSRQHQGIIQAPPSHRQGIIQPPPRHTQSRRIGTASKIWLIHAEVSADFNPPRIARPSIEFQPSFKEY
eukprot:361321-Chlamydomonas_euryale.AAC.1